MDRKVTLTRAFFIVWAYWVMSSLPHAIYEMFVNLQGYKAILSTVHFDLNYGGIYSNCFGSYGYEYNVYKFDYIGTDDFKAQKYYHEFIVEAVLRALKLSYGFVNSLVVIILVKPFHEPVLKVLRKCRSREAMNS